MKARASFRSQLVIGSLLWTLGLLVAISILAVHVLANNPAPHKFVYQWFFNAHLGLVLVIAVAVMEGGA